MQGENEKRTRRQVDRGTERVLWTSAGLFLDVEGQRNQSHGSGSCISRNVLVFLEGKPHRHPLEQAGRVFFLKIAGPHLSCPAPHDPDAASSIIR